MAILTGRYQPANTLLYHAWLILYHEGGLAGLLGLTRQGQNVEGMVSPLTKVTGLTADQINNGVDLGDALETVRTVLSKLGANVVLVGQKPQSDIKWCQLQEGVHFKRFVDISEDFKVWNPKYGNYNYFSLAKEAFGIFGVKMHGVETHSPLIDAQISMRLFTEIVRHPSKLATAKSRLDTMTRRKLFPRELMANYASKNIDGVCGYAFDPKKCTCGQPTMRN